MTYTRVYITQDTESGTAIDAFPTYPDARQAVEEYEAEDIRNDSCEPNFYEIMEKVI